MHFFTKLSVFFFFWILQSEFGEVADVDDVLLFFKEDIEETNRKTSLALLEGSLNSFLNGFHFELNYSIIGSVNTGVTLIINSKKDSFSNVIS